MKSETASQLLDHHQQCGGFEFTKSDSVLGDPKTLDRYVAYWCNKCGAEIREAIEYENSSEQQKAA
jgi:hypothetical protein